VAKAGSDIPVKFSPGGYRGRNTFAADPSSSQQIGCSTSAPLNDIEQTVTAGGSSLSFDAASDTLTYVGKTDPAWKGMCSQLIQKLNDDCAAHTANFQFK
jgi:hypothetical protein